MGEYHNNLTLEEAIKIYESIPAERLHGIKGIGFDLQDGDEDYSGEYELMSADRIRRDLIDMIPHYKESPLVQKAIADMEKYLDEKAWKGAGNRTYGRNSNRKWTETFCGCGRQKGQSRKPVSVKSEPVTKRQNLQAEQKGGSEEVCAAVFKKIFRQGQHRSRIRQRRNPRHIRRERWNYDGSDNELWIQTNV